MIQTLKKMCTKNDSCYLVYQGEKENYDNISIMPFNEFLENKY